MPPKRRTTRASPATTTTPTSTPVTDAQLRELIERGVAAVLAERDADRSRNGDDSHDSGTGGRRQVSNVRECTYTDFLKCQPMNFKGTEGVVGLTQWLEKMESVFHISNCTVACQVKFATCTLQGNALTWWNSHVRAVGHDTAYAMPWKTLKKMITDKYCPRSEIKKLETEMWNLKVKGTDVMSYNQRFQELVLMCDRMFPEESDVVEKYVGGLPDMIHGSVKASKPKTMQEAIEFATKMMDKKILTIAERQAENKRKFDDTPRNNQNQQQPFKRNNVARAYTVGPGEKKPLAIRGARGERIGGGPGRKEKRGGGSGVGRIGGGRDVRRERGYSGGRKRDGFRAGSEGGRAESGAGSGDSGAAKGEREGSAEHRCGTRVSLRRESSDNTFGAWEFGCGEAWEVGLWGSRGGAGAETGQFRGEMEDITGEFGGRASGGTSDGRGGRKERRGEKRGRGGGRESVRGRGRGSGSDSGGADRGVGRRAEGLGSIRRCGKNEVRVDRIGGANRVRSEEGKGVGRGGIGGLAPVCGKRIRRESGRSGWGRGGCRGSDTGSRGGNRGEDTFVKSGSEILGDQAVGGFKRAVGSVRAAESRSEERGGRSYRTEEFGGGVRLGLFGSGRGWGLGVRAIRIRGGSECLGRRVFGIVFGGAPGGGREVEELAIRGRGGVKGEGIDSLDMRQGSIRMIGNSDVGWGRTEGEVRDVSDNAGTSRRSADIGEGKRIRVAVREKKKDDIRGRCRIDRSVREGVRKNETYRKVIDKGRVSRWGRGKRIRESEEREERDGGIREAGLWVTLG
ncbi:putative reverse transcriptase domain-containing protein [Tanacetum coccineum]